MSNQRPLRLFLFGICFLWCGAVYAQEAFAQKRSLAAIACDTINILEQIIDHSDLNIVEGLKQVRNYPGLMGQITIDELGEVHVPLKPAVIKDGQIVVLHRE